MTAYSEEQKNALRDVLYNKSVKELVDIIIQDQEEIQEAKQFRSIVIKVRNLVTPPDERRKPGRPKKD